MASRKHFLATMAAFAEHNNVGFVNDVHPQVYNHDVLIHDHVKFYVDLDDCADMLSVKNRIEAMHKQLEQRQWVVEPMSSAGTIISFCVYFKPNINHNDHYRTCVMQVKNEHGEWEDEMIGNILDRDAMKTFHEVSKEYIKAGYTIRTRPHHIPLNEGYLINKPLI